MVTRTTVLLLLGLISLTILASCGGPPEYLDERYRKTARTLAIVASSPAENIVPANRSNLEKPGGGGGGILGSFARGLAEWEYNKAKADLYLSEDLWKGLAGLFTDPQRFDYVGAFDSAFLREFSVPFELITDSAGRPFDAFDVIEAGEDEQTLLSVYRELAIDYSADLVLAIYYAPRLALFSGRISPTPMIRAQVDVIDPNEGKLLMSTTIHTDRERRRIRSAEDLAADSCALYRKEFVECVRVLARQIAVRLGTELSMKQHSYWANRTHLD